MAAWIIHNYASLKIRKKSSEYAKKFYQKEEVGACRAVSSSLNSVYLCMRILHSGLNSAALSANWSPSHKPSPFPEKIVQVGAAKGASSSASVSPEPFGRSAALRQTDFPQFTAGAAAHAEDAGGRGQTAAEPTPAPPWVQPQHMTVGRKARGRADVVVVITADGQTGLSIT